MHHSTAMRARKFMTLSYSKACLQRGGLWCCMAHGNGHVVPLPPEQVRASNGYMPSGDIVLICAAAFSWNTGMVWIEVSSFADSYFLSQLWDTGDLFSSGCRCSNHPSGAHNRACSRARCFVLSTVKVRGYYPGGFSFPFVTVVTTQMLASTHQCNLRSSARLPHGLAQPSAEQKNIRNFSIALLCPLYSFAQRATANPGAGSYFNGLGKSRVPLTFVFKTVMTVFQVTTLWGWVLSTFLSMASQPGFLLALAIGPQQSTA